MFPQDAEVCISKKGPGLKTGCIAPLKAQSCVQICQPSPLRPPPLSMMSFHPAPVPPLPPLSDDQYSQLANGTLWRDQHSVVCSHVCGGEISLESVDVRKLL